MTKRLIVFTLTILAVGSIASIVAPSVSADWLIDRSGALVQIDGAVLGDQVAGAGSPTTQPTHPTSTTPGLSAKIKLEQEIKARSLAKPRPDNVSFTATPAKQGLSVSLHVDQTSQNDAGKVTTQKSLNLAPADSLFVEQTGRHPVEIKAISDHEVEIAHSNVTTDTNLPVTVSPNNQLVLTNPHGQTKTLTVLPDEAKSKLVEQGLTVLPESNPSEGTAPGSTSVSLTENNSGDPVYRLNSEQSKHFLGLIPVKFSAVSEVNATTGGVVTTSQETSPWRKLLERLSL